MHSTYSLRHCINCQETGYYSILCTKPYTPLPTNNLNAIHCDFCVAHHYGSQSNKKKESPSVTYSNRTKNAIRTSYNLLSIPERRNQPDLIVAQWLHDTTTLNLYYREMGNEGSWEELYFRLLNGHSVQDAKLIDRFLHVYQGSTCQLIIPRGLRIQGMSGQNFFIQLAPDNTGHRA